MILKDFKPAPDVQEFVQLYRIVHLQFNKGETIPFKAYPPRPEQCLAFYPLDTEIIEYRSTGKIIKHLPVVLYGQFTEVTNRIIGNNFLVVQIIFNPGALYRLTKIPSSEITNQYLDAEFVFGTIVRQVNEQLYNAKDYGTMIELVNQFIRNRAKQIYKNILPIDEAFRFLINTNEELSIKKLAQLSFLSAKQFERKCKERLGVNPKLFERIIRFDKAFRLKNSNANFDWLRIALECNYYDYQHLAKEYKDFTGLSPSAFHAIENNAPERKFGLSEGYYNQ